LGPDLLESVDFGGKAEAEIDEAIEFAFQLGGLLGDNGKLETAANLYRFALKHRQQKLGTEHPDCWQMVRALSFLLSKTGDFAEAEDILRKAIPGLERFLSGQGKRAATQEHDTHLTMLLDMKQQLAMVLGAVALRHGPDEEALAAETIALYEEVLAKRREQADGTENKMTISTMNNMAYFLGRRDDPRALGLFEQVVKGRTRLMGPKDIGTLNARQNLAQEQIKRGQIDLATSALKEVCEGKIENIGLSNPSTLRSIAVLLDCLVTGGDIKAAHTWLRRIERLSISRYPAQLVAAIEKIEAAK